MAMNTTPPPASLAPPLRISLAPLPRVSFSPPLKTTQLGTIQLGTT